MIQPQRLLADLQSLLPRLEQDILAYTRTRPELEAHLEAEYAKAREANRTAEHFVAWREAQITQAAAAWVLTGVFIRFLEDNRLLEAPLISGPADSSGDGSADGAGRRTGQGALQQAKDRQSVYFAEHPTHAERDYLLSVFEELATLPAMAELLDRAHNPLWQLPLSADGAKALIDFFQRLDPATGEIIHDFTDARPDGGLDTRFLGDLYQDLSESVRKRYALLQTPEFVERFILDHTLEPAKAAFGLPGLKLIDPTCGSGHFLLSAFQRLFDDWQQREPATNARALVQRALDAIHGVDINPYAIAIARFRLLIAAMAAAGSDRLKDAPDFHFNLAVGDSLLHGWRHESQGQGIQGDMLDDSLTHVFEVEDKAKLERILGQRYPVVVGNPPYITVKDKALNQAYRDKYPTCHRQYSLGVPFTERFFDLALPGPVPQGDNRPAGFVGMITANSFMKREFGKKLIEAYLPRKDLTHVIDTSGAYIPGHGTPTVILFGRNQTPRGDRLRAVLGIRGEPSTPEDAAQGKVWRSIVDLLERPGSENAFISVVDQERGLYARHPWSVGGGGASELKELIESAARTAGPAPATQAPEDATHASGNAAPAASPTRRSSASRGDRSREAGASSPGSRSGSFVTRSLGDYASEIGFGAVTREDQAYLIGEKVCRRIGIQDAQIRPLVEGEWVRDWSIDNPVGGIWPYAADCSRAQADDAVSHFLWPLKTQLSQRVAYGLSQLERGLHWFEYSMFFEKRFKVPLSITFAEVATHNHFVLDSGGKVFKQTAPVIKLPAGTTVDDHLALLGLLNSSTACFWIKQVFHCKGSTVDTKGARQTTVAFENFYQIAGTGLKQFPIAPDPEDKARDLAHHLDQLARDLTALDPSEILSRSHGDHGEPPASPPCLRVSVRDPELDQLAALDPSEILSRSHGDHGEPPESPPCLRVSVRDPELDQLAALDPSEILSRSHGDHGEPPESPPRLRVSVRDPELDQLAALDPSEILSRSHGDHGEPPESPPCLRVSVRDPELDQLAALDPSEILSRSHGDHGEPPESPPCLRVSVRDPELDQLAALDPSEILSRSHGDHGEPPESPPCLRVSVRDPELDQLAALDPSEILSRSHGDHGEPPESPPCLRVSVRDPKSALAEAEHQSESLRRQMIALQEELDWLNYRLYGLTDDDLCYGTTPPEMRLGERPFEILLARRLLAGETQTTWFARHNSTPATEIPDHWPADYRELTERRLQAMADNPWIRLIEQPEYKRRWNREPPESRRRRALRDWLLDHLEGLCQSPELLTVAQLAERARHAESFQQVAALYTGSDTFDARTLVGELVEGDQVPQMAAARYKPKAMPKHRAWRETWDKQRAEDAIDARTALDPADPHHLTAEQAKALKAEQIGDIQLPPKYASTDFRKPSYWGLRGKLDVPKERFFSLPGCERAGDATPVIGWAGLDHLQRAGAIATWYLERKEQDGWGAERLLPMLVALDELIPWLKQWHNALDPEFGERLGDYYEGFLLEELRRLELSRDELQAWEPAATARGRRSRGESA